MLETCATAAAHFARAVVRSDGCAPAGAGEEDGRRPSRTPKKRLREEITSHRQELDALQQSDPAFYKFLQDTDAELLDFDDDAGAEAGTMADSDEEDEAADASELLDVAEVRANLVLHALAYRDAAHSGSSLTSNSLRQSCPASVPASVSIGAESVHIACMMCALQSSQNACRRTVMTASRTARLVQRRSLQVAAHLSRTSDCTDSRDLWRPAVMTDLSALLTGLCPAR